jgi:hypothetical protein
VVLAAAAAGLPAFGAVKGSAVVIEAVESESVSVGGQVILRGRGLDQAHAVLFADMSPEIVLKTPTRLVFLAPSDPKHLDGYKAIPYVVIPGRPLVSAGVTISVSPSSHAMPLEAQKGASEVVLREELKLGGKAPKTWRLPLEGARRIEVTVKSKGGEVEARLAAEGHEAHAVSQITYGGSMSWRVPVVQLVDEATSLQAPRAVELSLSVAESALDIPVSVLVIRMRGGAPDQKSPGRVIQVPREVTPVRE